MDDLTNKELAALKKAAEFPTGWLEVDFGELFLFPGDDVVDGPFGSNLKASEYISDGVPVVRLQNIDRNQFVIKNIQYVSETKTKDLARHTFIPGDILITKLGDPLGKACIAPTSIEKGVLVADVVRARLLHKWIDRNFLCYQINAENVVRQFKSQTKGTTRPRVNLTKIRALRVRVCPAAEQSRIVEKLEELLSDLDAGVAELKAAQEKLTQYRQSLLKAAVEGRLTAEWRAKHPLSPNPSPTRGEGNQVVGEGEVESENSTPLPPRGGGAGGEGDKIRAETGAQLLEHILAERRRCWEEKQLAKFKEQGKIPPKDWRDKYPEPVKPNTTDLPELPDGWVWASVDQLSSFITSGSRGWADYYSRSGALFIRSQDINTDRLDLSEIAHVELPALIEGARTRIEYNDVLLTITGANVGKCAHVDVRLDESYVSQHVALIRPTNGFLGAYLHLYLTCLSGGRGQLNKLAYGAGKPGLNLQQVASVVLPITSEDEIKQILIQISSAIVSIDQQMKSIEFAMKQSSAQRQNILKAAFSGQLVPQDPNDEPASVLLERIRAERAARESGGRRRGRKTKEGAA